MPESFESAWQWTPGFVLHQQMCLISSHGGYKYQTSEVLVEHFKGNKEEAKALAEQFVMQGLCKKVEYGQPSAPEI